MKRRTAMMAGVAALAIIAALVLVQQRDSTSRPRITVTSSGPTGFGYERVVVDPATEPEPWLKGIGDLNGDKVSDLVVAGRFGRVVWYETPSWTKHVIAQKADSQSGSAVSDLDGDGDNDVIIGITWHENMGNASSWQSHELPFGNYNMTHDIVVADLNGDGLPDIAMRGETNSRIYVYQQKSPADWTLFLVDPGSGRNGLDVADVNGDNRPDLIVGGKWMENPGGPIATAAWPAHTFAAQWPAFAAVKVADLNGGRPDIVASVSEEAGPLSWFEQLPDDKWVEHPIATGLDSVHGLIITDLDHDGLLDIVASEYNGAGRFTIYHQGAGQTWRPQVIASDHLHNVQTADLNGDCRPDFFGAYSLSEQTPVIAYLSTGPKSC